MTKITKISTQKLVTLLENNNTKLIDVRPIDAYNGWEMQNEKRGGHIKGAKSLPLKWNKYIDWIEIVRSKNISPEHTIIVYAYKDGDAKKMANHFSSAGYKNIHIYNHFLSEWVENENLAMDRLTNYKQLIYPEWLKTLISGGTPPEFENKDYVICHAHYRNHKDYEEGHIPGAIALNTLCLEAPETWNRRSPEELKQALESHGITADTTVILYGRFSFPNNDDPFPGSSAGHLGSIRSAFIMMYAGVKDVKVLNGGIQSWEDAGYEITKEDYSGKVVSDFGVQIPQRPKLAVDIPQAKKILKSEDGNLVCVRSWPEYIGEVSGYNYIEKTGRIPGAVWGNCGSDAYHMENYRSLDHTTREFHEIEEIWKEMGITADKHNAFYCGTGWRGSEAFFNAYLMGWPRVSVFDDGWFGWSNDPGNPTETGDPK